MVLVDTSVLIDHFRGIETRETVYFSATILKGNELSVCGLVMMEVLQGFWDDREYSIAKTLLDTLFFLPTQHETYLIAAEIHRKAKKHGCALRGSMDCLIAACAITHNARLLQSDKDYSAIVKFSKLKLVEFN